MQLRLCPTHQASLRGRIGVQTALGLLHYKISNFHVSTGHCIRAVSYLTEHSFNASYSPCTNAHVQMQAIAARTKLGITSILGRCGCVGLSRYFIGTQEGVIYIAQYMYMRCYGIVACFCFKEIQFAHFCAP